MVDLQDPTKWRSLVRNSYQVERVSPREYVAISSFTIEFNKPILVAGGTSETAPAHYYLAANATQLVDISPTNTNRLRNFVEVGDRQKIPLDRMKKLEFEDYGIYPYYAKIDVPYWLEDVRLEIWEFSGRQDVIVPSLEYLGGILIDSSIGIRNIDSDLERIEQKVDHIDQQV